MLQHGGRDIDSYILFLSRDFLIRDFSSYVENFLS